MKNQHFDHRLSGQYALDEPNKGLIDFSLTATGVHNKSEKNITVGNPEIRIPGPGSMLNQHALTLPMEKVKSLTQKYRNLIENRKPMLWEITSLIGSLCSTAQAVNPAFLQIRYLQQQQVEYTKKQFPYHSIVHLNQNSIQELI